MDEGVSKRGDEREARLVTAPRAGALAGVLFAVFFTTALVIIRTSLAAVETDSGTLMVHTRWLSFALGLVPFSGIFFLWFIAVVRQRLGRFEDQFFATVFLGSGLVFLAMVFVASGLAGAIVLGYARHPESYGGSETYFLTRDLIGEIFTVYAMRMAAIFVFSQATLWMRTGVMPRWLAVVSYVAGLVLLFSFTRHTAVVIVFPAWVFLISGYILIRGGAEQRTRSGHGPPATDTTDG